MDWQAWYIALQVIETANGSDCHDWIAEKAVQQFRANEAEQENLRKFLTSQSSAA